MKLAAKSLKVWLVLGIAVFALPTLTLAQHYKQTNLVSDIIGMAPTHDPNLVMVPETSFRSTATES